MLHRIERWLWYFFLFAGAWQTRVVLWHADAVFSEWRAMALWGTDLLMLALFVLAGLQGWRIRRPDRIDWLGVALIGTAALSLIGASAPDIGLYQLARLVQYVLFFLYLRHWALGRFSADGSVLAFVGGAFLQACIAIGQDIVQHDLGLRWLGETRLEPFMRGVAVFFDGPYEKVLRAYGTLPHPNILAMLLGLALWGLGWLWLRHAPTRSDNWRMQVPWVVAGAVLLWAFGLTYARTVAAVWMLGTMCIAAYLFSSRARSWRNLIVLRSRMRWALALCAIVGVLFVATHRTPVLARLNIHAGDEAVQLRLTYARDALASGGGDSWISRVNWFGVGIGNFTSWLAAYDPALPSDLLQPAHSVYLMAYAETGVIGFVVWAAFLIAIAWHARRLHADQPLVRAGILVLLGAVLLAGTWDHFFWTLQQGRILWWLVLALAAGASGSYNQQHD